MQMKRYLGQMNKPKGKQIYQKTNIDLYRRQDQQCRVQHFVVKISLTY
jgi:hypothetical protein